MSFLFGFRCSAGGRSGQIKHGALLGLAMWFGLLAASVSAQEVSIRKEYGEKIKAAQTISPLGADAFGNSTNDATGQTMFVNVDIDLPGNSALPVRFGRRLAIEPRYIEEELGGLGNWDIDVPYIEGTFSSANGWTVAPSNHSSRNNRCSFGDLPRVDGALFSAEEVFHGYRVHVPGVLDELMMRSADNLPNPSSGTYRWVVGAQGRVSCLASVKNGMAGEGFVLHLADGTRYHFDFPVERRAPTLRKGPTGVIAYSMPRKRIFMLATRIEDRFGNFVTYQYASNGRLMSVVANDGRRIDVQQTGSGISATANGRQWAYAFNNGQLASVVNPDGSSWTYTPFGTYASRPQHPEEVLSLENFSPEESCQQMDVDPDFAAGAVFSVVHPGGARARFDFSGKYFYRNRVPYLCMIDFFDHDAHVGNWVLNEHYRHVEMRNALLSFAECINARNEAEAHGGVGGECGSFGNFLQVETSTYPAIGETVPVKGYARPLAALAFPALSLAKVEVTGAGLNPLVTQYAYEDQTFGYCGMIDHQTGQPYGPTCAPDPCSGEGCVDGAGRWTEITLPNGDKSRKRYGVMYGVNEGLLLEEQVVSSTGQVMRHVIHAYIDGDNTAPQSFVRQYGYSLTPDPMHGRLMPHKSTEIRESGESFISEVSSYDIFGRPLQVLKTNSMGYLNHRVDAVEYHDNFNLWVIGQARKQYTLDSAPNGRSLVGGAMISSEVEYNGAAQAWRVYKFGRLDATIAYHTDGTIATVADGKGNVTTFGDWKRGIPRSVRHPATPEALDGATESAVVDDNGWITALTDEAGSITGYGYDAMGRLASILQPTGDAVAAPASPTGSYYGTTRVFRALTDADWKPPGISTGQWYLYEQTGNHASVAYMDALWRPVLTHEYDTQNINPTMRAAKSRYDSLGRVSFASYPSSDLIPGDTGTRTTYDALGRVTRVEQDAEGGSVLATTTEYLSYLRTRVTNPRGAVTTNHFMAWDQPTYDFLILSQQPEGKVVSIDRHPQFGWPLKLTQRNPDKSLQLGRRYVYDGAAQICKTIEPETGVAMMGYDGAANLVWQASGLDGTSAAFNSTADCQHVAAYSAGRTTTRAYDARNRLTHLNFPNGGQGNQIWTYKKDGLPESVTTYNDINNATPVVTTYAYNNRRLLIGETLAQPGVYSWSIGYAYNGYGHLSTQTYPTGLVVDYAPNPLGQPTKAGTYATGAQYYPNGALKQFTYGNGIVHTMTQNARQLPQRVSATGNAMDYEYGYDPNGNVAHVLDHVTGTPTARHRWMTYDNLDRLTSVASAVFGGSDHTHRFTYDALDNLESWKHAGVKDYADYVYDAQNRLTNIRNTAGATVVGIDYDEQGNLRNKNGQGYIFDFGNRLRSATGKEAYRYDGLGRRVQTTATNGKTTLWQYTQGGQMLFSSDWGDPASPAQQTHENVYLAGSVVAIIDHAWPSNAVLATKYQHTDALGSPVAVTNASGQVIERMDYEPWGAIIGKPNHNGIGYTGHVMDGATGLTYMQQRYYDQSIGRFLSVDPVTAHAKPGQNFNRYWYAANNPYKFVDPDGRWNVLADAWNWMNGSRQQDELSQCFPHGCSAQQMAAIEKNAKLRDGANLVLGLVGGPEGQGAKAAPKMAAAASRSGGLAKLGAFISKLMGGCSFDDDTLVQTDRGLVPIAKIKVGDRVLAKNEETGVESYQDVIATFSEWHESTLTLSISNGKVDEAIITTDEHPFYVNGEGFVPAGFLKVGDVVRLAGDKNAAVVGIKRNKVGQLAYNLTVANDHTYFVGHVGALVHNSCDSGIFGSITGPQAKRIQAIADKYGVNIDVIGSRARGNAHADSDWDYVITGGNSKARSNAFRDLPRGRSGGDLGNNGEWTGKERIDPEKVYADEPRVSFSPQGRD